MRRNASTTDARCRHAPTACTLTSPRCVASLGRPSIRVILKAKTEFWPGIALQKALNCAASRPIIRPPHRPHEPRRGRSRRRTAHARGIVLHAPEPSTGGTHAPCAFPTEECCTAQTGRRGRGRRRYVYARRALSLPFTSPSPSISDGPPFTLNTRPQSTTTPLPSTPPCLPPAPPCSRSRRARARSPSPSLPLDTPRRSRAGCAPSAHSSARHGRNVRSCARRSRRRAAGRGRRRRRGRSGANSGGAWTRSRGRSWNAAERHCGRRTRHWRSNDRRLTAFRRASAETATGMSMRPEAQTATPTPRNGRPRTPLQPARYPRAICRHCARRSPRRTRRCCRWSGL